MKIDRKARILRAQVHLFAVVDQPPIAPRVRQIAELERHHDIKLAFALTAQTEFVSDLCEPNGTVGRR